MFGKREWLQNISSLEPSLLLKLMTDFRLKQNERPLTHYLNFGHAKLRKGYPSLRMYGIYIFTAIHLHTEIYAIEARGVRSRVRYLVLLVRVAHV